MTPDSYDATNVNSLQSVISGVVEKLDRLKLGTLSDGSHNWINLRKSD
jgi:hypothetical protein